MIVLQLLELFRRKPEVHTVCTRVPGTEILNHIRCHRMFCTPLINILGYFVSHLEIWYPPLPNILGYYVPLHDSRNTWYCSELAGRLN